MKIEFLLLFLLSIFSTSCRDNGSRKTYWQNGYMEGYQEAKLGLSITSIDYGPDLDGTKSQLKIAWQAYRAGWEDFKQGRPYNWSPPAK